VNFFWNDIVLVALFHDLCTNILGFGAKRHRVRRGSRARFVRPPPHPAMAKGSDTANLFGDAVQTIYSMREQVESLQAQLQLEKDQHHNEVERLTAMVDKLQTQLDEERKERADAMKAVQQALEQEVQHRTGEIEEERARRRHEVVKQTSELSQEREDRTKELQFLRHRIEEESRQRADQGSAIEIGIQELSRAGQREEKDHSDRIDTLREDLAVLAEHMNAVQSVWGAFRQIRLDARGEGEKDKA